MNKRMNGWMDGWLDEIANLGKVARCLFMTSSHLGLIRITWSGSFDQKESL